MIQATSVVVSITDQATHGVASVGLGAGTYSLIVDTASANTWVQGELYKKGPQSKDTKETVRVGSEPGALAFRGKNIPMTLLWAQLRYQAKVLVSQVARPGSLLLMVY